MFVCTTGCTTGAPPAAPPAAPQAVSPVQLSQAALEAIVTYTRARALNAALSRAALARDAERAPPHRLHTLASQADTTAISDRNLSLTAITACGVPMGSATALLDFVRYVIWQNCNLVHGQAFSLEHAVNDIHEVCTEELPGAHVVCTTHRR